MPMLRPQKEKKPPQPGKLKMFGHIGHLGHLTPKHQQNRPFFNLSKMANNKYLGHLARPFLLVKKHVDLVDLANLANLTPPSAARSMLIADRRLLPTNP